MAIFIYKAVTRNGQVVSNRVDEISRYALMKKLKANNLMPISVTSINAKLSGQNVKRRRKNIETSDSVLKAVREQEMMRRGMAKKSDIKEKLSQSLNITTKIKQRDIVIFTQNLYLLKKANFNNIHALSTIIETTENASLRAIIEDILLGVEAGETMHTTMEYYVEVFSPIYVNMIKVGELSRFTNLSIRTSS